MSTHQIIDNTTGRPVRAGLTGDEAVAQFRALERRDGRGRYQVKPETAETCPCGNWSVVIDHVPGQSWEAYIEGEPNYGWEADDAATLLASVAAELTRQQETRS